jgi:hypothetical protein
VDIDTLKDEFVAARAEIFGLAWGHKFNGRNDVLLRESVIAKVCWPTEVYGIGQAPTTGA